MTKLVKNIFHSITSLSFLVHTRILFAATDSGAFVFDNPIFKGDNNVNIFGLVHSILEFVVKIGTVLVIFMVIYSGFLFVKAQGDPGEISKARETFFWTVIGGVVLIGAQVLAQVICNTAVGLGAAIQCSIIK